MTAPFIESKLGSAADFIDELRRTQLSERRPEFSTQFIYRGQADASWGLTPSAFRPGAILGYGPRHYTRRTQESSNHTWEQGNAELVALFEFLTLAEKVGLDIPPDHKWLRRWNPYTNLVGSQIGTQEWPPEDLYESLAIAQHHGVPTRLLDFSYDPLIAAHFGAAGSEPKAKEIAVWAVDLQLISKASPENVGRQFQIVTVPRGRNRNLVAQKALFLLDRGADPGAGSSMENRIERLVQDGVRAGRMPENSCAIRKFCLPSSECPELVALLMKLGIDHAQLMPSFDGVVKELEARRRRAHSQETFSGSNG